MDVNEILSRVIEALRDTAAKTEEIIETVQTIQPSVEDHMWRKHPEPSTVTHRDHRYPREWVAGRLLGMADMVEAMTAPKVTGGEP